MSLQQAIEVHEKTIEASGGGTLGQLDVGKLESVLQHIENDDYYPTFDRKLAHLFFSACKFHCFVDGNKRIAIATLLIFLYFNDNWIPVDPEELYQFTVWIASSPPKAKAGTLKAIEDFVKTHLTEV